MLILSLKATPILLLLHTSEVKVIIQTNDLQSSTTELGT